MTPERIEELRALAEKATTGPWSVILYAGGNEANVEGLPSCGTEGECIFAADAAFIAAARTALPEALDHIEALQILLRAALAAHTETIERVQMLCDEIEGKSLVGVDLPALIRTILEGPKT